MARTARTFRVFVSSTFEDLGAERNKLQESVFPRLREFCARQGARFQAIDLRWGVSTEASLDQRTMDICLGEIRRCLEITPRPNFLVLLGQRHGWRPPPARIPADEFDRILEEVTASSDRDILNAWYRRDDNAVPVEFLLRPRSSGTEFEDDAAWSRVESRLRSVVAGVADSLGLAERRLLPYTASATEQEIAAGALDVPDPAGRVFCFFRTLEGAVAEDGGLLEGADRFIDLDPAPLEALKARLRDRVPFSIMSYSARWSARDQRPGEEHLDEFAEDVFDALAQAIEAELESPSPGSAAPEEEEARIGVDPGLDHEGRDHRSFADAILRFFVGRRRALREIQEYLEGADRGPLVVAAAGGAGKSALLAKALQRARVRHPDAVIVYRFIGATPDSSDARALLASICRELARRCGSPEDEVPGEYRDLVPELARRLDEATAERPVVLFLDALDQLSEVQGRRDLAWLPPALPEHVGLVVSSRRGETLAVLEQKHSARVDLEPLSRSEGDEILDLWLEDAGRALQSVQRAEVLSRFEQSDGRPLYLRLAFEEARRWASYDPPESLALGISGIIRRNLLARLALDRNHGLVLVSRALGYLAASRHGLAEDEMLDLLSRDEEVYSAFLRGAHHLPPDVESGAGRRLPVVLWSRLSFDLAPYLTERVSEGVALLDFYHRELEHASSEEYLQNGAIRRCHSLLAGYFRLRADPDSDGRWAGRYPRGLAEAPYHLTEAGEWQQVESLLTDFRFLERKMAEIGAGSSSGYAGISRLQDDYVHALARLSGGGAAAGSPVIVTPVDLGSGCVIVCPRCNRSTPLEEGWLGREIDCPQEGCGGPLSVTPFVCQRRSGS